jgi:hypothetical protein
MLQIIIAVFYENILPIYTLYVKFVDVTSDRRRVCNLL